MDPPTHAPYIKVFDEFHSRADDRSNVRYTFQITSCGLEKMLGKVYLFIVGSKLQRSNVVKA